MRRIHLVTILVLLALALPASPAHAGGVVTVCDEAHLLAALASGGTVTFACSGTIILSAEIVIDADTTIDGSGKAVTISGNDTVRVFTVNPGVMFNLNRLTVAHGSAPGFSEGGGIYNYSGTVTVTNSTFSDNRAGYGGSGGGINNNGGGTLIVIHSVFSGNSAFAGGGILNAWGGTVTVTNSTFSGNSASGDGSGGGIANGNGTLSVSNSTFSGNSANGGGGIQNSEGAVSVSNSTFSGNSAGGSRGGGGILNEWGGTVTVSNSTFSGNGARAGGGVCDNGGSSTTLKNTVVANSPSGGNCSGTITDGGGNLSYPDTTCPGINSDPMLGPLQDNGGPTHTMDLGPGSAAFEAGNNAICAAAPVNNLDQRGVTRPQGGRCDIGAVEHLLPFRLWLPIIQ